MRRDCARRWAVMEVTMKSSMRVSVVSAAVLATIAGQAMAQVAVDGKLGTGEAALYGAPLFVQNQPTGFGDNVATSNAPSTGANVRFGHEFSVPVASLGLGAETTFRIAAFMTNESGGVVRVSNQVVGADVLGPTQAPLGNARELNFASVTGNQYLTLTLDPQPTAPVLDGVVDDSTEAAPLPSTGPWAGARRWVNQTFTNLGNNTLGVPNDSNGSELDNFYAIRHDNGTAGDLTDDVLYFFVGGNFNNFNRTWVFVDAVAGGQNRLVAQNADWAFGQVRAIGASTPTATNGLTFDAGFEPEGVFIFNTGNNPNQSFWDWVTLPTASPDGSGGLIGTGSTGTYLGGQNQGETTLGFGGNNTQNLAGAFNNSNILGVAGGPPGPRTPSRDIADGSEINALFGYVDNKGTPATDDDELNLLITGNLETNFNKLTLFFDVKAGEGQSTLRGSIDTPPNVDADFNGLNRMGFGGNGAPSGGTGLTFDAPFAADYWMAVGNGNNPVEIFINAAVLRTGGRLQNTSNCVFDFSSFDGGLKSLNDPVDFVPTFADAQDGSTERCGRIATNAAPRSALNALLPAGPVPPIDIGLLPANQLAVALDNSNILGVSGTSVGDPAAVTTGVEVRARLSELGWDGTSPIRVAGFISNGGYEFASNQVIGGLDVPVPAANLGDPSAVDFNSIPGTQFVVIPAPPSGPVCDSLDYNQDGDFPTPLDLEDFIAANAGNICGSCSTDLDFNNDGDFPTPLDIEAFISVNAGGPCL